MCFALWLLRDTGAGEAAALTPLLPSLYFQYWDRQVEVLDWAVQRDSSGATVGATHSVSALTVLQVGAHKPAAAECRVTPAAEGESSLQPSCRNKTLLLP